MDDQTPEMERITAEMRELMRLWVRNPNNREIKQRFDDLHAVYQRMFVAYKQSQQEQQVVGSGESRSGGYEI